MLGIRSGIKAPSLGQNCPEHCKLIKNLSISLLSVSPLQHKRSRADQTCPHLKRRRAWQKVWSCLANRLSTMLLIILTKGARWMMREGITAYISHEDVVDSDLSKILACKSSPHAKSATLFFNAKKNYLIKSVLEFLKMKLLRGTEADTGRLGASKKPDWGPVCRVDVSAVYPPLSTLSDRQLNC